MKIGLFTSLLYHQEHFDHKSYLESLENKFGDYILFNHPFFPMKNYYSKEMGDEDSLKRLILYYLNPVEIETVVQLKLWAMEEESKFSIDKKRVHNLDIGFMTLENMQLLTSKPYAHRVYLSQNIYSDLTYIFEDNSYQNLPWTYPDYANTEFRNFFNYVRSIYKVKLTKP